MARRREFEFPQTEIPSNPSRQKSQPQSVDACVDALKKCHRRTRRRPKKSSKGAPTRDFKIWHLPRNTSTPSAGRVDASRRRKLFFASTRNVSLFHPENSCLQFRRCTRRSSAMVASTGPSVRPSMGSAILHYQISFLHLSLIASLPNSCT